MGARPYRMNARADSAARTADRIVEATAQVFWENPGDVSLDEVAATAGVSVRTILRRFGSKGQLLAETAARQAERVREQRDEAPVGDIQAAVAVLVEHYEQLGEAVIRMLAAETSLPDLTPIVEQGRRLHWDWCRRVFGPYLDQLEPRERRRRLAQCVAITDVYTWKILRRDAGMSRAVTQACLTDMIERILKEF